MDIKELEVRSSRQGTFHVKGPGQNESEKNLTPLSKTGQKSPTGDIHLSFRWWLRARRGSVPKRAFLFTNCNASFKSEDQVIN